MEALKSNDKRILNSRAFFSLPNEENYLLWHSTLDLSSHDILLTPCLLLTCNRTKPNYIFASICYQLDFSILCIRPT